ncbi:MAG: zinc ribbon domain-containing protein [Candidatus Micrarchaeota archaeon]
MKNCESCGMPMDAASDFGGGKATNRYCKFCTYPTGDLMPRHVVRENMVKFYMKNKRQERAEAETFVDSMMARMPAWQ